MKKFTKILSLVLCIAMIAGLCLATGSLSQIVDACINGDK